MSELEAKWDIDAEKLIRMEERSEKVALKEFRSITALILATIDALWPGDDAPEMSKKLAVAAIERLLKPINGVAYASAASIAAHAEKAVSWGVERGLEGAQLQGVEPDVPFKARLSEEVLSAINDVIPTVMSKVIQGTAMLERAITKDEVLTSAHVATSGMNNISMAARWTVNAAANDGMRVVADASPDLTSVLRPERNGCVTCLGKAGSTERPPFHPRCRCTSLVLERESAKAVSEGLKREAERSILRGWSLPSESEAKRLKAARDLLARGTNLPKSVQAYARSAINRGQFPRGRDFPGSR